jgi:hypothetical protein
MDGPMNYTRKWRRGEAGSFCASVVGLQLLFSTYFAATASERQEKTTRKISLPWNGSDRELLFFPCFWLGNEVGDIKIGRYLRGH